MTPFKPDYASQRDKRQKLTCCGWATEECDGRRLLASPEQLEEEERDNAYKQVVRPYFRRGVKYKWFAPSAPTELN